MNVSLKHRIFGSCVFFLAIVFAVILTKEPKLYKIVCTNIASEKVLSATVSELKYEGSITYFVEGDNKITLNNIPCMSFEIKGELDEQ